MDRSEANTDRNRDEDQPDRPLYKPFAGLPQDDLMLKVEKFLKTSQLTDYKEHFVRGALLAQSSTAFDEIREDGLELDDKTQAALRLEFSDQLIDRFKQPVKLYLLVACCSLGAAVQGWDQTAVNGAQIYFRNALNVGEESKLGLINGAPYLCCALACCLNYPLNKLLNRRGVIFATCLISSITCLLQAFSKNWWQLFLFRFLLGFGIGPKSATIPIYAAEAAPENIRGALVMMWQMWTAFGIMCGYIFSVAFANVGHRLSSMTCRNANDIINIFNDPDTYINNNNGVSEMTAVTSTWDLIANHNITQNTIGGFAIRGNTTLRDTSYNILLSNPCSMNWRLMLASPMILPLVVVAYVYTLPESPRVLLRNARKAPQDKAPALYEKAFKALEALRNSKVQAARDLFLIDHLLCEEQKTAGRARFLELFKDGRCRRALIASLITMFLQQFCGVNVTAYYSSKIMKENAGWSDRDALLLSMGFGIINFLFAFPAVWTIDKLGRRKLLLYTLPFMALFQGLMVIAFALRDGVARRVLAIAGMYLFGIAYSPGLGPVPFVYSAESMPLYNRDYGMGIVTAINWALNFFVSMTWPVISAPGAMKVSGAFAWYAVWCLIGWWMILLFVPETKDFTLEDLDQVFKRRTREYMTFGMEQLKWFVGLRVTEPVFLRPPPQEFDEAEDVGHTHNGMPMTKLN